MKKFFKRLLVIICCIALIFLGIRFGPNLYYRIFGSGNTHWISERFSEELREKNELVVYETTLTGQETISQSAWLLGKVQEVIVPYSFSISYMVDLSQSSVTVRGNTIEVRLPAPKANFSKLTVDEAKMKKYDWLYPLTPERYASIKTEIETMLFDECATKPEYLDSAWTAAIKSMESLFRSVADRSEEGMTCDISVIQEAVPAATEVPAAQPAEAPSVQPAETDAPADSATAAPAA